MVETEYSEISIKLECDDLTYDPNRTINLCGKLFHIGPLDDSPNIKLESLEFLADGDDGDCLITNNQQSLVAASIKFDAAEDISRFNPVEDTGKFDTVEDIGKFDTVEDTGNFDPVEDSGNFDPVDDTGNFDPAAHNCKFDPVEDTGTTNVIGGLGNREAIVVLERLRLDENQKPIRPIGDIKPEASPTLEGIKIGKRRQCRRNDQPLQWCGKKEGKATFGVSKKGQPQLKLDGFLYNRKAEGKSGTVYWKCVEKLCRTWVKQKGNKFNSPLAHELSTCIPYQPRIPKVKPRKVHRCTFCEKIFSKRSTWVVHERTHTGEKPFVCPDPICKRTFATSGALISHRRSHIQEKQYKCLHCKYRGLTSSNLKDHTQKWHTVKGHEAKHHGCEHCKKTFAKSKLLIEHQYAEHSERRPYKCSICSRSFRRMVGLSIHRRAHDIEELELAEVYLDGK